ncbi:putative methyltransferase-domain-containing protein [Xylariaceae sp. FL0016]|nr:putative methyltransferase-domain-containing protein [Xylariaceae sp. FL0016]
MHYIRLLRPAKCDQSTRGFLTISVLFTVTTDLGDSFLCPGVPLELVVSAQDDGGQPLPGCLREKQVVVWTAGMRVLEAKIPFRGAATRSKVVKKEDVSCVIKIHPANQGWPLGVLKTGDVLPPWLGGQSKDEQTKRGAIMPVTVEIARGQCAPVSVRTLQFPGIKSLRFIQEEEGVGEDLALAFEEDIGDSIARHIWDAGVVTACLLADACQSAEIIREFLPALKDRINIIELGSGVGILGITIAGILNKAAEVQGTTLNQARVLLTDLPEAEERALSNIARAQRIIRRDHESGPTMRIEYENLDWDEGKEGHFGPLVTAVPWDLVVLSDCTYNVDSLPALIGTLSALHAAKEKQGSGEIKSSVILATKPRHSSEQALFGMLGADGWRHRVLKNIPLPKIGDEDEVVEIYLLEKGTGLVDWLDETVT